MNLPDYEHIKIDVSAPYVSMSVIHPKHKEMPIGSLNVGLSFWVSNDGLPFISKHGGPIGGGLVRIVERKGDLTVCAWGTGSSQVVTAEVPSEFVDVETNERVLANAEKYPSSYGLC